MFPVLKIDLTGVIDLGNLVKAAGKKAPQAIRRAIAHTGPKANTAMKIALVAQTGLKRRTMDKALKGRMEGNAYVIRVKGGDAKLSKFTARETRGGVSAAPWNKRQVFAKTFMKGGHFPNRVAIKKLHGQVFIRTGKARFPIKVVKSGVVLPVEMTIGESAAAFERIVQRDLGARLDHELSRIF